LPVSQAVQPCGEFSGAADLHVGRPPSQGRL
jgi:hypothetical protein